MSLTPLSLTMEAGRVLGVLLEKNKTTPDHYPLTLTSLIAGCNQSTNRNPVTNLDEMTVERALTELRDESLALRGVYAGSRVPKHRHSLDAVYELSDGAVAVLTVLLLRGEQTLGELKQRTERIYPFKDLDECDTAISELVAQIPPLAQRREKLPGQKEGRVIQVLAQMSADALDVIDARDRPALQLIDGDLPDHSVGIDSDLFESDDNLEDRVEYLEKEVTVLTHEIMSLRAEIDSLRDPSA